MVICHSYVKLLPFSRCKSDVLICSHHIPLSHGIPTWKHQKQCQLQWSSIPEPRRGAFQGLSVQVWHPMWAVGIVQRLEFCRTGLFMMLMALTIRPWRIRGLTNEKKVDKIKGPDHPTSQLLPTNTNRDWSGMECRKNKEEMCARVVCERVVGGSDVRERDISGRVGWGRRECARVVCEKVVGERAVCVCVWKGCLWKSCAGQRFLCKSPYLLVKLLLIGRRVLKWPIGYGRRCERIIEFKSRNRIIAGTSDWSGQIRYRQPSSSVFAGARLVGLLAPPALKLKNWTICKFASPLETGVGWSPTHTHSLSWILDLGYTPKGEDEMRWNEMKWDEMRWNEMKWDEMRWNEMKWDEMRWNEMKWDEMRWNEMKWDEMRWNEIMSWYVMFCYHVMSARVVYGLATWPYSKCASSTEKADNSKPLHQSFRLFRSNQRPANKAGNGMCCFSQCLVVTWNVVLKCLCTWAVGVTNEVWCFACSN